MIDINSKFIRKAESGDPSLLGPNLRSDDLYELKVSSGTSGTEALTYGFQKSTLCYTALTPEGKPCGMFGLMVGPVAAGIWALFTPDIEAFPKVFLQEARKVIDQFYSVRPILANRVAVNSKANVNLLEHLGFKFIKTERVGPKKDLFLHFIGEKHV